MKIKRFLINQDILKIIALITMTIDHACKVFLSQDTALYFVASEAIGRTAFPVFSFLLMYHLCKKQIFQKYFVRLISFGLASAALFLLFPEPYGWHYPLNILLTFAAAIALVKILDGVHQEKMPAILKWAMYFGAIVVMTLWGGCFEYSMNGLCFLISLYFYFKYRNINWFLILLFTSFFINPIGVGGTVSLLTILLLLNVDMDKKHPRLLKHWQTFYIYYPLHLVFFFSLAYLLAS